MCNFVFYIADGLAGHSVMDRPVYGQSITIMNDTEKQLLKQARKEEKKLLKTAKQLADDDSADDFNPEALRAKRLVTFMEGIDLGFLFLYQYIVHHRVSQGQTAPDIMFHIT